MLCSPSEHGDISLRRRILIAVIAIGLATLLLHAQVASALLDRGDALMGMAKPAAALQLYARAAQFDAQSPEIAERRAFAAYLGGDVSQMQKAVIQAHTVLERYPQDGALLIDDALCSMKLHHDEETAWAYQRAGRLLKNPQLLVLAGWAKARLHAFLDAKALWNEALMLVPGYPPARFALQHYREKT